MHESDNLTCARAEANVVLKPEAINELKKVVPQLFEPQLGLDAVDFVRKPIITVKDKKLIVEFEMKEPEELLAVLLDQAHLAEPANDGEPPQVRRQLTAEAQALLNDLNAEQAVNDITLKTRMCKYFPTGCRAGGECKFAHSVDELRNLPSPFATYSVLVQEADKLQSAGFQILQVDFPIFTRPHFNDMDESLQNYHIENVKAFLRARYGR
jgi:hypothetical protein